MGYKVGNNAIIANIVFVKMSCVSVAPTMGEYR